MSLDDNRNHPNCDLPMDYHNVSVNPGAGVPGGVSRTNTDTQLDVMDGRSSPDAYTPEMGLKNYSWPGLLTIEPDDYAGFIDEQRDVDDVRPPAAATM